MTIELTPEQKQYVEQQIATGRYTSESELVQHALEVLQRRDEQIAQIQEGYQQGLADLAAGRSTTIDSPEAAKAFGEKIKQRGRELQAERENAAR